MSCILHARGAHLSLEPFLEKSRLKPYRVWRKGESRPGIKGVARRHRHAGMSIEVSGRGFDDLKGQIRDAVRFAERHRADLRRLSRLEGLDELWMDFGIRWLDVAAQSDHLPPALLRAIAPFGIGIVVSHYPISDEPDDDLV